MKNPRIYFLLCTVSELWKILFPLQLLNTASDDLLNTV